MQEKNKKPYKSMQKLKKRRHFICKNRQNRKDCKLFIVNCEEVIRIFIKKILISMN